MVPTSDWSISAWGELFGCRAIATAILGRGGMRQQVTHPPDRRGGGLPGCR